jgi:putative Holliday junction resolvase
VERADGTLLAFDFGMRRIGVAVGNTVTRSATPLTTIDAPDGAQRFAAIGALVDEWRPDRFVVGLPVHADGRAHAMTQRARAFGAALAQRFARPVAFADERHTREAATRVTAGAGRAGRARRDELAAAIILQAWLDETHDA